MKLHIFPPSPGARKCLVTADLAGVAVETVLVDLLAGDQRSPDFLALNPNGKIPVLEMDDGTVLWESNAIVNRLADLGGLDLFPKSEARFPIVQWQFWEMAHWVPQTSSFIAAGLFGAPIDRAQATEDLRRWAAVLDEQLSGRDWLVGEAMTTADLSVAATLCYRDACAMPLDGFDGIARWLDRIEALPAWARVNTPWTPPAA